MDHPVSVPFSFFLLFGYNLPNKSFPSRYYQSSSCAVRSAVSCYHLANKWTFPASYLNPSDNITRNEIILSLPYNATDYESAVMPRSIYMQYDALRLEVK